MNGISFWPEIGQADFKAKRQAVEAELIARAMMVGTGSTQYLRIDYSGNPYCLDCKTDAVREVVPKGYQNGGLKVWVCPNYCGNWEPDQPDMAEKKTDSSPFDLGSAKNLALLIIFGYIQYLYLKRFFQDAFEDVAERLFRMGTPSRL